MYLSLFFRRIIFLQLFSILILSSFAQKSPQQLEQIKQRVLTDVKVATISIDEERQTPSFISLKGNGADLSKSALKQSLGSYLNLRSGIDELRPVREVADGGNFEVVEFHQYYKGVKVEHSRYTALLKNGKTVFFNGAYFEVPAGLPLQARLGKDEALKRAKGRINVKKYAWEMVE